VQSGIIGFWGRWLASDAVSLAVWCIWLSGDFDGSQRLWCGFAMFLKIAVFLRSDGGDSLFLKIAIFWWSGLELYKNI
jgi:hypothetical protein